ncbi:MAG: hypothetical protein Kow0062_09610 [Acidobacteriota bacterium]
MQYTEEQKAMFKAQFSARRRRQIIVAIPFIAIVLLLVFSQGKDAILGIPIAMAGAAGLVLILGGLVFSFYNWRCPACNRYLGKAINPGFCARCGVELR